MFKFISKYNIQIEIIMGVTWIVLGIIHLVLQSYLLGFLCFIVAALDFTSAKTLIKLKNKKELK